MQEGKKKEGKKKEKERMDESGKKAKRKEW